MGEYGKAILNNRRALDFMPNNADIHHNLGLVYGTNGMVREMQEEIAISRRLKGQVKQNEQHIYFSWEEEVRYQPIIFL